MSNVDLRPLSLGEILDRTFTLYRSHFLLFLGIAAIPHLLVLALSLAQTFLTFPGQVPFPSMPGSPQSAPPPAVPSAMFVGSTLLLSLATLVVATIAYLLSQGATVFAVSDLYLGNTTTIGQSFLRMRGEMLGLFGVVVLNGLALIAGFILLIIPGIYLACRLLVVIPAALLEGAGPRTALERSMSLTRDNAGRAFLILLLYVAVAWAATGLFAVPFEIGMLFSIAKNPAMLRVWMALMQVGSSIASILVGPILTIATAVLYFDLRVRKEALDIQMMMTSGVGGTPAPLSGGTPTLLS
ncbi:MAG: hypothetical protein ACLP1Y_12705 [Candidatus Acidiferrales bacterium]